jgi:hypothetical protein
MKFAPVFCCAAMLGGLSGSLHASLVGHWTGDNTTIDSAAGNDGTWNGSAAYGAGVFGDAFSFSGSSSISIASAPAYQFGTGDFSVSFWVNFAALENNTDGMFHKDDYGEDGTTNGWLFNIDGGGGGVGWLVRDFGAGQTEHARSATVNFDIDTWYHLAGVREGSTLRLYVDGTLVAETTGALVNVSNTVGLDIGSLSAGSPQFFNGKIDDVRLYNHALNAGEVIALIPEPASTPAIAAALAGLAAANLRARRRRG